MTSSPREENLPKKLPRKIRKPLMEKRRRARINHSLDTLKLLLTELFPESKTIDRWEKADILEMTVNFLKTLRHGSTRVPERANSPRHEVSSTMSSSESPISVNSESTRNSVTPGLLSLGSESTRNSETSSLSNPEEVRNEDSLDMPHCYMYKQEPASIRNPDTSSPLRLERGYEVVTNRDSSVVPLRYMYKTGFDSINPDISKFSSPEIVRNPNNFIMAHSYMHSHGGRPANLETPEPVRLEQVQEIHIEVNNSLWRPFEL